MDPEVGAFYVDGFGEDERLRLRAHGVLERVRTQELLARFLPPPATVLDVGGGTGVHAAWLAQRGYSVHLIDPVEEHVAVAARLSNVSSAVGDARCLSQADESQDAVWISAARGASPKRSSHFCTDFMRPGSSVVTSSASRPRISTFPTSVGRSTVYRALARSKKAALVAGHATTASNTPPSRAVPSGADPDAVTSTYRPRHGAPSDLPSQNLARPVPVRPARRPHRKTAH